MNKSLRSLIAVSLLMAATVASATYCPDNSPVGDHVNNDCHAPFKDPTKNVAGTTNTNTALSGSLSNSASRSASASRSNSRSTSNATGGKGGKAAATATGGNQEQTQAQHQLNQQDQALNNDSSNAVNVNIDQSSTGSTGRSRGDTVIIPPGLPPLPGGVALPSSNIAILPGRMCAARQMIIQRAIYGREYGWDGEGAGMIIGYRDVAVQLTDGNGIPIEPKIDYVNGIGYGHVKSSAWAKLGISVNNALGVSLYHKTTGGSAQGASGGQIEILVRDDVLEECFYSLPERIIHAPAPPPEIRYIPSKPKIIYRDRPKATPCCQQIVPVCCTKQ